MSYILINTETNEVTENYIPITKRTQKEVLAGLIERIDALLQRLEGGGLPIPPKPVSRKSIIYTIGKGVSDNCPSCHRKVVMPVMEKVEEKRPETADLPCGCAGVNIIYEED